MEAFSEFALLCVSVSLWLVLLKESPMNRRAFFEVGKSIGFLPLKVHTPSDEERQLPGWANVSKVFDEWLLLEYACVFLPAQGNAVVESVGKSLSPQWLEALGLTTKGAVPYHECPKAPEDRPWNAAEAISRLKQWASLDSDKPDWAMYRQAFAYYENDGTKPSDYKLPNHDVIADKLHTVWHGVHAAMGAFHGARTESEIPKADQERAYNHLAKHYQEFAKEAPDHKALSIIPFTTLSTIGRSVSAALATINSLPISEKATNDWLDRKRGRV
jgi:hypothetical protein